MSAFRVVRSSLKVGLGLDITIVTSCCYADKATTVANFFKTYGSKLAVAVEGFIQQLFCILGQERMANVC